MNSEAPFLSEDDYSVNSSVSDFMIDISGRDLASFPEGFMNLDDITEISELDLSHNRFSECPNDLFKLTNLVSLDFSYNDLLSIPNKIAALQQLKRLDLRHNQLKALPEGFEKLRNLEVLILSGNQFQQVPQVIFRLPKLKELQMGGNLLADIPPEICQLVNLEILYLGDNQLVSLPESMGTLPNLTALALAVNRLETLPVSFERLHSLRTLTLHNNKIKALPTGITRLQNLEQLNIRSNPLITDFVNNMTFEPATLTELAARIVKLKMFKHITVLPPHLRYYLGTANQCVNPKCKGVYFEAKQEHIKFVDFCGKYRVPLMQYLCSSTCSSNSPAYALSSSGESEDEAELPSTSQQKMRKREEMVRAVAKDIQIQRKFLQSVKALGIQKTLTTKTSPIGRRDIYTNIDRHMNVSSGLSQKIFSYMKQRYQYERKKLPTKRTYTLYHEFSETFEMRADQNSETIQREEMLHRDDDQVDLRRTFQEVPATNPLEELKHDTVNMLNQRIAEIRDPVTFVKFVKTIREVIWISFARRNQHFEKSAQLHELHVSRYPTIYQAHANLNRIFDKISTPAALRSFTAYYIDQLNWSELDELKADLSKVVKYSKKVERNKSPCFLQ